MQWNLVTRLPSALAKAEVSVCHMQAPPIPPDNVGLNGLLTLYEERDMLAKGVFIASTKSHMLPDTSPEFLIPMVNHYPDKINGSITMSKDDSKFCTNREELDAIPIELTEQCAKRLQPPKFISWKKISMTQYRQDEFSFENGAIHEIKDNYLLNLIYFRSTLLSELILSKMLYKRMLIEEREKLIEKKKRANVLLKASQNLLATNELTGHHKASGSECSPNPTHAARSNRESLAYIIRAMLETNRSASDEIVGLRPQEDSSCKMGVRRLPPRGTPGYSTERRPTSLNIQAQHQKAQKGKLIAHKAEASGCAFNVKYSLLAPRQNHQLKIDPAQNNIFDANAPTEPKAIAVEDEDDSQSTNSEFLSMSRVPAINVENRSNHLSSNDGGEDSYTSNTRFLPELYRTSLPTQEDLSSIEYSLSRDCVTEPNERRVHDILPQTFNKKEALGLWHCCNCHEQMLVSDIVVLIPCGHIICKICLNKKIIPNFRQGFVNFCECLNKNCHECVHSWTFKTGFPSVLDYPTLIEPNQMLNRDQRVSVESDSSVDLSIHTVSGISDLPTYGHEPPPTDFPITNNDNIPQNSVFVVNVKNCESHNLTQHSPLPILHSTQLPIFANSNSLSSLAPLKHSLKPYAKNVANGNPQNFECWAIQNKDAEHQGQSLQPSKQEQITPDNAGNASASVSMILQDAAANLKSKDKSFIDQTDAPAAAADFQSSNRESHSNSPKPPLIRLENNKQSYVPASQSTTQQEQQKLRDRKSVV